MRFRLNINVEIGDPDPPEQQEREGSADALVEMAIPQRIGFAPMHDPIRRPGEEEQ